MIKIAFVIDTIESPTAGTEKQLLLLIKHLDRGKFKPYLCVLRSSQWLREKYQDCEVIDIGVPSFGKFSSYSNIWHFVQFLKHHEIDIVQTHFVEGNKIGVLAAKLAGVKAVVSTRRNQGYWHNATEKFLLKILNRWVTLFLANSHNTAQWAVKIEGIPFEKIQVIHNGIEIQQYAPCQENRIKVRKQIGIADDVPVIGIVANLRPVKGLDVFVKAAKTVIDTYVAAQFIIVGEGDERQPLTKMSQELGIEEHVTFLGSCENIPSLLPAFDIGVLSSHSESFSNAIVEYMAAGLPVVCTDVGGAREAIVDGINGYVVPPGDHIALAEKLNEMIRDCSFNTMGDESSRMVKELFSISAIIGKYQNFYTTLMGAR